MMQMLPKQATLFLNQVSRQLKLYEEQEVQPQMPPQQLQHFLKQAARLQKETIIQYQLINGNQVQEISGYVELVPHSGQIIIHTKNTKLVHLIYPSSLRHIRLA